MPRGSKRTDLQPLWWIAYGVACGLAAAGLILLLAAPRRGAPVLLLPAPTAMFTNMPSPTATMLALPATGLLVNVNTATAEELALLPGIGPALAQSIVAYREANGPFELLEQLQNVPDIGPATFQAIQPFITLGDE